MVQLLAKTAFLREVSDRDDERLEGVVPRWLKGMAANSKAGQAAVGVETRGWGTTAGVVGPSAAVQAAVAAASAPASSAFAMGAPLGQSWQRRRKDAQMRRDWFYFGSSLRQQCEAQERSRVLAAAAAARVRNRGPIHAGSALGSTPWVLPPPSVSAGFVDEPQHASLTSAARRSGFADANRGRGFFSKAPQSGFLKYASMPCYLGVNVSNVTEQMNAGLSGEKRAMADAEAQLLKWYARPKVAASEGSPGPDAHGYWRLREFGLELSFEWRGDAKGDRVKLSVFRS